MPEVEVLTYTVTPGPEVLAKMGTSWTLFTMPPVMFTVGPDGEPPEPATVNLTEAQALDLAGSGYVVEAARSEPEPVDDVRVSPGLEGVEPEEPALVTYAAGLGEGGGARPHAGSRRPGDADARGGGSRAQAPQDLRKIPAAARSLRAGSSKGVPEWTSSLTRS